MKSTKQEFLAMIKPPLFESMFRKLILYFDDEILVLDWSLMEQKYTSNWEYANIILNKRQKASSSMDYLVYTQDALISFKKAQNIYWPNVPEGLNPDLLNERIKDLKNDLKSRKVQTAYSTFVEVVTESVAAMQPIRQDLEDALSRIRMMQSKNAKLKQELNGDKADEDLKDYIRIRVQNLGRLERDVERRMQCMSSPRLERETRWRRRNGAF